MITKKTLITWSIVRDALNWMLIGQLPGVCQMLDIPLLIMHYKYAGASASFTLLELIPGAGFIPIFTIAAFCYADREPPLPISTVRTVRPASQAQSTRSKLSVPAEQAPGLYAYVDGKLTPVKLNSEQLEKVTQYARTTNDGGHHA